MDKRGELNEHQALQLMEHRATVKTARELRAMIADMDFDKNHRLSFIELCCAYFTKPYEELNNFVDEEARAAALEQAKAAADRVRMAEEEQRLAKEEEERKARELEAEIEAEKKLVCRCSSVSKHTYSFCNVYFRDIYIFRLVLQARRHFSSGKL